MNQKVICDVCGKEFEKKKSMTNHRRWHDLPEYKEYQEKFRKTRSKLMTGQNNSFYGKQHSEETKGKISESLKGKNSRENHYRWVEDFDKLSYWCKHIRMREKYPKPKLCESCHQEKILELHNISGKYKADLNDWTWICRKCHITTDERLKKVHENIPNRLRIKGRFVKQISEKMEWR